MRKFLIVVLTSLAAMTAHAWEPTSGNAAPDDTSAQVSYAEALVTIGSVPMPATVIELARYAPDRVGVRPVRKAKAAKVATKSVLSRSAREQMVLANTNAKPDDRARLMASDDEDDDDGLDDQDLHRSYSRPKVAKTPDQVVDSNEDVIALPEHVKLRLLMARTKALDAFMLSQAGKASGLADEPLSDTVKLRLFIARTRALQAHSEKFGDA